MGRISLKYDFFRRRKAGLDMGICWKRNNEIQRVTTTSVSNHHQPDHPHHVVQGHKIQVQDEIN